MIYIKRILLLFVVVLGVAIIVNIGKKANNGPTSEQTIDSQEINLPDRVEWPVPFTAQAPLGNWEDVKQGNGCEEASILMAYSWSTNKVIDPELAAREIVNISDYSFRLLGHFHDISNGDTLRLLKEYFEFDDGYLDTEVRVETIKARLADGNVLIVAVDGDILDNPNYQIPAPANHKIVITGYDETTKEFITNDPGTSRGEGYRYKYDQLLEAITDYPTGYRESFEIVNKSMVVVAQIKK